MKISFRTMTLAICLAVAIVVLVFMALYLDSSLYGKLVDETRQSMRGEMALVKQIFADRRPAAGSAEEMDALADELGELLDMRLTIIRPDGVVVGDTDIPAYALVHMDNHAGRPEIQSAMRQGTGWSLRRSSTRGIDFLYVAQRVDTSAGTPMVLRLALPLSDVKLLAERTRNMVIGALLLGLLFAFPAAYLAAHFITRPIRELTRSALDVRSGNIKRTAHRYANNEIGVLGQTFDQIARDLNQNIVNLSSSQSRLASVMKGISDAVLVTDASGRITKTNQAFLNMFHLSSHPVNLRPVEVLRYPELLDALKTISPDNPVVTLEMRTYERPPRYINVVLSALSDEHPGPDIVAVFQDVTERINRNKAQKEFVDNVSHELRIPLAAIHGAVETLREGALKDPPKAAHFVEMIDRNATRLDQIILGLMDVVDLETGAGSLKQDIVHLQDLAADALDIVSDQARKNDIELEHEWPEEEIMVRGDAHKLEQALINLLENAIKYTSPGGTVTLEIDYLVEDVYITVTDTGIGMESRHLDRIFDRFYRVDGEQTQEVDGTGLGLAIVKQVTESHGGTVDVESTPGQGSSFSLILPVHSETSPPKSEGLEDNGSEDENAGHEAG